MELEKAYESNDFKLADTLIYHNRLLVKPFVNGLISESIHKELQGRIKDSKRLEAIASKAVASFEEFFVEKSLSIGVSYLTSWNKEQKEIKLDADTLYDRATRYRLNGENENALTYFKPALEKYREIGDERGEAEVLGGLGALYYNNYENYDEALNYYNEALVKRIKVDDRQLIGNTLNSLGAVFARFYNDYTKALEYYEKAEAIRSEIGDQTGLRTVKANEADACKLLGDQLNKNARFPESIEKLERAVDIDNSIRDEIHKAGVLSLMGFVYSKTGDFQTAMEKLTEAEKITRETGDSTDLAGVYNHFGIVLQRVGRIEKALEYYNIALKTYENRNDLANEIPVIDNIGTIYSDLKQYEKAEEYLIRGLKICKDLNDREKEVDYLLNLANDQIFLKKLDESRSNYEKALVIVKSMNNPDLIWKITLGLAENYEQSDDPEKAVELNDSALAILEGLRSTLKKDELKASYMARERYVYEDLIDMLETLYEKNKAVKYDMRAFSYAERSKSRVLLDLLSGISGNEKRASEQASLHLNSEIHEVISLDEAQLICPDKKTVILEYITGDSCSYLWAITRAGHKVFKLPVIKQLQEQVETIRFALQDPNQPVTEFFTNAGSDLYDELIKPAKSFLPKSARLIIIPDGILNYLPFEVLLTDKGNKATNNSTFSGDLPFLLKKHSISYAQSASILRNLINESSVGLNELIKTKTLIAFGDPVLSDSSGTNGTGLQRLEYSGDEVRSIASFFNKGASELFLGTDATEENVKREGALSGFGYIHFATHGLINESQPDLSSLLLTSFKGSKEDGLLTASEISGLKINADIVVLSACQTGLGKLVRGEGMIGLTRAFMYAGAPSVMVSLWNVSDRSTASLMEEFYKNLVKNRLSKTDALRKTQLTLIADKKHSHPFYWAPFILIGDWR